MGTIKITLRKDKPLKKTGVKVFIKGQEPAMIYKYPLELVYQISGERKYFNTGEKVFEDNWKNDDQKAVFIKKGNVLQSEVNEINDTLEKLCQEIRRIERRFEDIKQQYSPEMVIDELHKIINPEAGYKAPTNNLFDFIDKYITDHEGTRVKGSLSVYKALKKHLQDYEKAKKVKVTFDKIDYSFFQSFYNFLISNTGIINVTANKQISTLKTFLGYAKKAGVNVSDKFKDFKLKQEKLEVIALTNEEFECLLNLDLSGNRALDQVRDVFCFACATGLRYSDFKQLRREHIKPDEIKITVQKTKDPLRIPLSPYSRPILEKYKSFRTPLPVISNQRMNEHLKDLCEKAGINEQIEIVRYRGVTPEAIIYAKYELIGCHTARKTFCTLSLEKGMSAEETMAVSGHTDYKSFKRYVTVTEQRKKVAVNKAWSIAPKLKAV